MQKARSHPRTAEAALRLLPLVGTRFQVLFHSPPGVLFTFPSRYSCTIGHGRVFSLGGWSPQIPTGFSCPRPTQVPEPHAESRFAYRALTLCGRPFQVASAHASIMRDNAPLRPYNPGASKAPVWALPLSLAATQGISFDFSSSRYLDVSVPWVGSSLYSGG